MAQLLAMDEIERAVEVLARGGLVAFPTETVYGLGGDAANPAAVAKIFAAKDRPADHPLIVHLASVDDVERFSAETPSNPELWSQVIALADAFWPGPLTVIVPRSDAVDPAATGGRDTVGLRVPDHPVAIELLTAFGGGVAAPSANRFGSVSPTSARHVYDELGDRIDAIIDGGHCAVGVESTIVDLTGPEPTLLRPGGISQVELEAELGRPVIDGTAGPSRAPGMLASHYAPKATVELVDRGLISPPLDAATGVIAPRPIDHQPSWALPSDPAGYAAALYATLRAADAAGVERLLIEPPDDGPLLAAVLDRLGKAAAPRPV